MGIDNLTCQKCVIETLNKYGHCLSYPKHVTPTITPFQFRWSCLSYFLVDNFDLETDKQYGGSAINITTWWLSKKEGLNNLSMLCAKKKITQNKQRGTCVEAEEDWQLDWTINSKYWDCSSLLSSRRK